MPQAPQSFNFLTDYVASVKHSRRILRQVELLYLLLKWVVLIIDSESLLLIVPDNPLTQRVEIQLMSPTCLGIFIYLQIY